MYSRSILRKYYVYMLVVLARHYLYLSVYKMFPVLYIWFRLKLIEELKKILLYQTLSNSLRYLFIILKWFILYI